MKELRTINTEFRIIPNSRKIGGYALLFNTESQDLGGFTEIIEKNSLDGVLQKSDVLALYNHNENKILARNSFGKGTLSLNVDNRGLFYEFEAPDTTDGNDLLYHIKNKNIRNSSFAFTVSKGGEKFENKNGKKVRTITKFEKIYDVSAVAFPAYSDTSLQLRSFDKIDNNWEEDYNRLKAIINKLKK